MGGYPTGALSVGRSALGAILLVSLLSATLSSCSSDTTEPGEPFNAVLSVVSGANQPGEAGERLDAPIVVRVAQSTDPVAGASVRIEIILGGGQLSASSIQTDSDGLAEVSWTLGAGPDYLMKVSLADGDYTAEAVHVHAATELNFETQWISHGPFRIEVARVEHDGRVLESNNFLTFSDASSDDVKMIYATMAEESFYELKQEFEIASSEELGIRSTDKYSKITIYCNRYLDHRQLAFPNGFFLYGPDSPVYLAWPEYIRERFRNEVKHETMHVLQWLLGLYGEAGAKWPEVWFTEGIAEYISGGAFAPVTTLAQVEQWRLPEDHTNPISIHHWTDYPVPDGRVGEYYPMFGLAVRYLLEESGHGKTILDVKSMFNDMLTTRNFATSFETYMGMSVDYYEENFFSLIESFLQ
jgi:hypothetical protein